MSTKEQMLKAKKLIESQRYKEARAILLTVDHPLADKWLHKLNRYIIPPAPPKMWTTAPSSISQPKDYNVTALIILLLYLLFYLPGLIANIIYWSQARQEAKRIGKNPDGMGCLTALLVVLGALPLLGFCFVLMTSVIFVSGS
jgi:hypothetical protein